MKITKKHLSRNRISNIFLSPFSKNTIKSYTTIYKSEEYNGLKRIPNLMKTYNKKFKKQKVNVLFSSKNYDKYIKEKYNNELSSRFFLNKDTESKISIPPPTTLRFNNSILKLNIGFSTHRKNKTNPPFSEYDVVNSIPKPSLLKQKTNEYIKNLLKNSKFYSARKKSLNINKNRFEKNNIFSNIFETKTKFTYKLFKKIDDDNDIIMKHLKQSNILKNNEDFNVYKILPKSIKIEDLELFLSDIKEPEDIIELQDVVKIDKFNDDFMKHKIRKTLAYEINKFDLDKSYLEYYKSIPNYINFVQDICMLPHIQNHFIFKKFKALDELTELIKLLLDKNCFHKDVVSALNKTSINMKIKADNDDKNKGQCDRRLNLLKHQGMSVIVFYKKLQNEENEKFKFPNFTIREKEELANYFSRPTTQLFTGITNDKLKNVIYHDKFFKINRIKKRKVNSK